MMTPYYQEPNQTLYCGHVLEVLRELPNESVDMVMTSPPYWGLRTYKTEPQIWGDNHCEHEWVTENFKQHAGRGDCQSSKKYSEQEPIPDMILKRDFCLKCNAWRGELGLEPTIELYISHLLQIFDEVKRILKKTGTCWVNIGDSYAGGKGQSGCGDSEYQANRTDATLNKPYHQMGGHGLTRPADGKIGVLPKSLCGIPERFVLGMQDRGWIRRNSIIWYKKNPMPESVKDRFTEDFEYLFFFSKQGKYYFEQQFEALSEVERWGGPVMIPTDNGYPNELTRERLVQPNPLGRNKRCVWEINTEPYPEAHFATFPEKLCETPILAGCPAQICVKCGKAREKVIEMERPNDYDPSVVDNSYQDNCMKASGAKGTNRPLSKMFKDSLGSKRIESGYTDCGCNAGFEPGVVLDPFCGSGTVMAVAKKLGRKAIGIDLQPKYCDLTVKRLQKIPLNML